MDLTPEVKTLYRHLLKKLEALGNIRVEERKTSVHLVNRVAFAGVHPRKNSFILNIVSDSPIKSERINKTEQVSKSRFHNELKVQRLEDIDNELLQWLRRAYELMN